MLFVPVFLWKHLYTLVIVYDGMEERKKLKLAAAFIIITLMSTMIFVHFAEGWSWVDSFYFAGVTMATVGYGDLTPTHPVTKIVITLDILFSVGLFLYSISLLAEIRIKRSAKWSIPLHVQDIPKHLNTAVKTIRAAREMDKLSPHQRKVNEIFQPQDVRPWLDMIERNKRLENARAKENESAQADKKGLDKKEFDKKNFDKKGGRQ